MKSALKSVVPAPDVTMDFDDAMDLTPLGDKLIEAVCSNLFDVFFTLLSHQFGVRGTQAVRVC